MSLFYFLRIGILIQLSILWVLYQFFIKKRKWIDLKNDAYTAAFFVVVLVGLTYLLT